MQIKIIARIINEKEEWRRACHQWEMYRPLWDICADTMKQLCSEQWLRQKGFKRWQP